MTQITIDLGDDAVLKQRIIEMAAGELLDDFQLRDAIKRRMEALTEQEILERVRPLVEEAMTAAVQPTDSFGKPKGEPTTLREVIVQMLEAQLKASKGDGYNRPPRETLLSEIIGREVDRAVGEDLRAAMDAARKRVHEAVQAKGAELLTETIAKMAR